MNPFKSSQEPILNNGAVPVADHINISGNSQASIVPTTSAVVSNDLAGGVYDVWCASDCYIKVAVDPSGVLTTTGYLLRAGNTIPIYVPNLEKIGAIVASGTATLYFHKVK